MCPDDYEVIEKACEKFLENANLPTKIEGLIGSKFSFCYEMDLNVVGVITEVISGTIIGAKITLDEMISPYLLKLFISVPQPWSPANGCLEYNQEGWTLQQIYQDKKKTEIIRRPGRFELYQ